MSKLPLHPVPSAAWQAEYERLMENEWLRNKMDRQKRIDEHYGYLTRYCREFFTMEPGLVIDIGPGAGELLEIARANRHDVLGIDAASGDGGMGDDYLSLSKLWTERQKIPVEYVGLFDWIGTNKRHIAEKACLINSRGSIEQSLSEFMVGPPHDEHHRADQLDWQMWSLAFEVFQVLFSLFEALLRPGGILLIHANGTKSLESRRWYDSTVQLVAAQAGLELLKRDEKTMRLHKWINPE